MSPKRSGWAIPQDRSAWVRRLGRALERLYGRPEPWPPKAPLDELVFTVLSQNTSDTNRDRAWASLRERFPTWSDVLDAPPRDVERALAVGGLARQKTRTIRALLARVWRERGAFSLDHLRDLDDDAVRAYLTSFHGVGPKTTECVLLFSLRRPGFPVDTHIDRVSRRLGLVPRGASVERAHLLLRDLVPPEDRFPLHLNLIAHGRRVCKAPTPLCSACAVRALCRRRLP